MTRRKTQETAEAKAMREAHERRNVAIDQLSELVKTVGEKGASMQAHVMNALQQDDTVILRAAERAVAYFEALDVETAERQRRKHAALSTLRTQLKRAFRRLDGTGIEARSLKVDKHGVASWHQPPARGEGKGEAPTAATAQDALAYLQDVITKMVNDKFLNEDQAGAMLAIAHGEEATTTTKQRRLAA